MIKKITKVTIIIPCYNEVENLLKLLELSKKKIAKEPVHIILVDNGSTDNTQEILKKFLPFYNFVSSIHVKQNIGYGYGIIQGLKAAKSDYIGWIHADLQTNPESILDALKIIRDTPSKYLFIKGKRYGRSLNDIFFTLSMTILNLLFLRVYLHDINSQPTIFHKSFFLKWQKPPYDFSLDLYAYYLAKKNDLDIRRIRVFFGKRYAGEAHLKNFSAKIKYSFNSLKYTISLIFKKNL